MRVIGVDTGGTFTDLVCVDGDEVSQAKVPSTPQQPGLAVLQGLAQFGGARAGDRIIHGTTVALNALLTGRVARTALVTGTGFRDLIEIGRQDRPDIYALHPVKPAPLVPRRLRFEVDQRSWPDPDTGALVSVSEPTRRQLKELAARLKKSGAESVAVCLLHAWADAAIETRVAEALSSLKVPITCSGTILPEHREYERFSTAVVNASLVPRLRDYLERLEAELGGAELFILQSNGGTIPAARAAVEPVRVLLSGPTGGVVGAARAAREAGLDSIVTLDMGGTSTDIAFQRADGEREATQAVDPLRVGGHPVGVPSLDIHTIGCGGGSLVSVDAGGILHVGPQSAGADPGPVCYGRSDRLTVTDAHVQLGHIREGGFLRGDLRLDVEATNAAFEKLGRKLRVEPDEAARGVLDVARAAMRRALSVMTMQRGQDPEHMHLVAFGGAGGLHAAALAGALGMRGALVPAWPGVLSAWGMSGAAAIRDAARTVLDPLERWKRGARKKAFAELAREALASLREGGHSAKNAVREELLDLRYRGQAFELRLPECADPGADPGAAFHEAHERLYGYALPEREVELVCLRVRVATPQPEAKVARPRARALPAAAILERRPVDFGARRSAAVVDAGRLRPGHRFEGPAVLELYSGTTLVPPGWTARVTGGGHLLLEGEGEVG